MLLDVQKARELFFNKIRESKTFEVITCVQVNSNLMQRIIGKYHGQVLTCSNSNIQTLHTGFCRVFRKSCKRLTVNENTNRKTNRKIYENCIVKFKVCNIKHTKYLKNILCILTVLNLYLICCMKQAQCKLNANYLFLELSKRIE